MLANISSEGVTFAWKDENSLLIINLTYHFSTFAKEIWTLKIDNVLVYFKNIGYWILNERKHKRNLLRVQS